MKRLTSIICALLGVVFVVVWLGFPASPWGSDTTVFGMLALVAFGTAAAVWE